MTRTASEPTLTGQIAALIRRVTNLERRATANDLRRTLRPLIWSYSGALVVSTSEEDWWDEGGTLYWFVAQLRVSGSSSTTMTFYKNGATSLGTLTIGSGVTTPVVLAVAATQIKADGFDTVNVDLTAVGTGASGLTVHGRGS